jgi:hypothetical protein
MRTDSAPVPPVNIFPGQYRVVYRIRRIVFQNLRLSFDFETAEFIVVNESILE